jgi:hypothetical protein
VLSVSDRSNKIFFVLKPDSLLGLRMTRALVLKEWTMSRKGTEQMTIGAQIACSHPSRSATMSQQKPAMKREEVQTWGGGKEGGRSGGAEDGRETHHHDEAPAGGEENASEGVFQADEGVVDSVLPLLAIHVAIPGHAVHGYEQGGGGRGGCRPLREWPAGMVQGAVVEDCGKPPEHESPENKLPFQDARHHSQDDGE